MHARTIMGYYLLPIRFSCSYLMLHREANSQWCVIVVINCVKNTTIWEKISTCAVGYIALEVKIPVKSNIPS